MAKLTYNWNRVVRGDIISFRYRTKENRHLLRTVLVLEPKFINRAKNPTTPYLLHGIQLEVSNRDPVPELQRILETAGDVQIVDEKKKIYKVDITESTKNIYKSLKAILKKHGIFKTFNYEKVRKSQVFLEDLRLPKGFVDSL